jgi:DNA-binding response OmpR family regulator
MTESRPAILVVDDEPDVGLVLQRILRRLLADYEILIVADAMAALSLLGERAVTLVFTNHNLPGMNGEQLAQHIKAQWSATRIVMISGMGVERLTMLGQALGLDGVLAKPFTIEEVRALLNTVLP